MNLEEMKALLDEVSDTLDNIDTDDAKRDSFDFDSVESAVEDAMNSAISEAFRTLKRDNDLSDNDDEIESIQSSIDEARADIKKVREALAKLDVPDISRMVIRIGFEMQDGTIKPVILT